MDIGECAEHALHGSGVGRSPVSRSVDSSQVGDHIRVTPGVHRSEILTVERVVALLHKCKNVSDTVGRIG